MKGGASPTRSLESYRPSLPDHEAMVTWLASDCVVSSSGAVRSWVSPDNTGYDYPEVAGLWLSFVSLESRFVDRTRIDAVAQWLDDLVRRDGGVGRDGRLYLFDSAVALAGLVAHARAFTTDVHGDAMRRLHGFATDAVLAGKACEPAVGEGESHWSLCFGSHLLKVAVALQRYDDLEGGASADGPANALVERLLPLFDGERFRACPASDSSYQHGFLYALEGLAWLQHRGVGDFERVLDAGACWLASVQTSGGGVPAFAGPGGCHGEPRADVVAQAVRLWTLLDATRWADNIQLGLRFLAALQDPTGGIRYTRCSQDVNVWVSLFAAQAQAWVEHGADVSRIL